MSRLICELVISLIKVCNRMVVSRKGRFSSDHAGVL